VTRGGALSGGLPNHSVNLNVTEGVHSSLSVPVLAVGFDNRVGCWSRISVSFAKQGQEIMDRYSYAVAVTYAKSKVAETSAVVVRCLSYSVISRLLIRQALTADDLIAQAGASIARGSHRGNSAKVLYREESKGLTRPRKLRRTRG
jgi:hypothetical protein